MTGIKILDSPFTHNAVCRNRKLKPEGNKDDDKVDSSARFYHGDI